MDDETNVVDFPGKSPPSPAITFDELLVLFEALQRAFIIAQQALIAMQGHMIELEKRK